MNDTNAGSLKLSASIFLLAYRMEKTILETLEGALAQTVPCEIIVSDDASDDRGFDLVVERVAQYTGRHRVVVRRNEANQGLCQHINTLAAMAEGDVFVFMAGDDVSHPHRVHDLLLAMETHPDIYAVGSTVDEIDQHGVVLRRGVWGIKSPMNQYQFLHCGKFATLLGASMAIRRELLIGLPPLQGTVEDTMLSLRASLFGPVYCLRESLLRYRRHENNLGNWVYSIEGGRRGSRRRRYERTIRIYREIADDHERCLMALTQLVPEKRAMARRIVSMYRVEADAREAVLNQPKRAWLRHIYRGLMHPGLRRKAFERAFKLLVPRRWMGL
ncbi:MAG: glycosyltransferase [Steroidobacteraceae bacterium]